VRVAASAHELNCGTISGSSAHSKFASSSLLEKTNTASASGPIWSAGPDSIVVSGATWSSIVHSHSAGTGSASRCCTSPCTANVCGPAIWPLAAKSCASV
jgi:hypothetical protein